MIPWDGEAMHDASGGEVASREQSSEMGELCSGCQDPYLTVYVLPNEVWDQISAGASRLCPSCADRRARKLGIELYWEAEVGEFPRDFRRRLQKAIAEHQTVLDRLADT